ncbi:MAG: DinB family protein [Pirellulales bacterium]|nr:DinB family protein [Pirellulales bacterium]
MSVRTRLKGQLATIRGITEKLLSVFTTPEQWTHQVHDQANHALWFVGHIGTVDDFLIQRLAPEKTAVADEYRRMFGMGSRPTPNPADYPPTEEVLAFMRQQRETLLEILAGLSEDDMDRPTPDGTPEFMPDVASLFEAAVWHEALHLGQVTVARRHLGNPPMVDG